MVILYFITAANRMNKNSKASYDERTNSRTGNRNNINIQINFNVKDKNQGFAGKKIDNYVEVEQKNTSKTQPPTRQLEEYKKAKKKKEDGKPKDKLLDTPNKQRYPQSNKTSKNLAPKTPEKKEHVKREERSKSTNQKLAKRKTAKSVENTHKGIKFSKNKGISPQSSGQKSRSRSKSSKKVIRSNDPSMKNLHVFSNSGLKTKINTSNSSKLHKSRERQSSAMSRRQLNEQQHEKLKRFMQEKKKKQKKEKSKSMKQDKHRRDKIVSELKKVEAERKTNASKPIHLSKIFFEEHRERLPIYGLDDDDFDESEGYDKLGKEASDLIHESPPRQNIMEGISLSQLKQTEKVFSSSAKKSIKKKRGQLVYRYLNGTITNKQLKELSTAVINIQRCYRGYLARKSFSQKLNEESTKIRYIRNKIQSKRARLNSNQDNSIVNLEKQSSIKIDDSKNSSLNYLQFDSKQPDNLARDNEQLTHEQKNRTQKFKNLALQLDDQEDQSQTSKEKSEKQTYQNSKMLREIQELRKILELQNQKYRSLEEQNQNLKANIKHLSLKESREIKEDLTQDMINSNDIVQIRMPKKLQSPSNQITIEVQVNHNEIHAQQQPAKKELSLEGSGKFNVEDYKKQLQAFQCSSPSNAKLEEQLKRLKGKNIENIFLKKEIKIDQKYQRQFSRFDQLLTDNIYSPRTYNLKKKDLQQKKRNQKEQIKQKIQQAKEIIGYIEDVSSQESDKEIKQEHKQRPNVEDGIKAHDAGFKKHKELNKKVDSKVQKAKQGIKTSTINENNSHSSYSSEDDRIYKKYWTDDIEQVHMHTLMITKKIEDALKAESEQSSKKCIDDLNKDYSSNETPNNEGYHSHNGNLQSEKDKEQRPLIGHYHSKSSDGEVDFSGLKDAYNSYLEDIKQLPTKPETKAKQIFNKIDLSAEIQCKSDEQMENSHDNLCNLLNQGPLIAPAPPHEKKQDQNLYITQSEFNQKKRKQEELQKSSSFQKSNKSQSMKNSSIVESKGFITNLTFIKQFCISVCEFIRSNEDYRQQFIDRITQAEQIHYQELLRAYRTTIGGETKNNYNTFQDQYVYPYYKIITPKEHTISHELFHDFMKSYEEEKTGDAQWNDPSLTKKMKQMRQFFLVSIVDNFNESLQYQKPGSVYGQPLLWLTSVKHLKNNQIKGLKNFKQESPIEKKYYSGSSEQEQTEQQKKLDQIFGASIAKIIQWGSCLCGFIADPMPMQMGDSQIANLSDEQLNSIRENRVGLMLQKWLVDEEENMTNSTSEYTEVLLHLGEKIIQTLMNQCSDELQEIRERY